MMDELTLNEKRLLAVLKELRDIEEARVAATEGFRQDTALTTEPELVLHPFRDALKVLGETKNIAFKPIQRAFELINEAKSEAFGPLREPNAKYLGTIMNTTEDSVIQYAHLLSDKGLAGLERQTKTFYHLTEEGKEYAEKGLPERNLINFFESEISMKDLQQNPQARIGIGWLKRKGWITIEKGVVVKTGDAPIGDDELGLKNLETASSEGIQELLKRKLVEEEEKATTLIFITPQGIELVAGGLDLREEVSRLDSALIREGNWDSYKFRKYSVKKHPKTIYTGKNHPYQALIDEMRQILLEMGFTEMYGDIIQSSFWNFDALFQPQDHPAREMQDTFFVDLESELPDEYKAVKEVHETGGSTSSDGWGGTWREDIAKTTVLRTHTTGLSIQYLKEHPEPPAKAFCIGRVYRREAIDPTHTPEFEQLEGIIMDDDVSFKDLLGLLKAFYNRMGFENVRFRPAYFPYTEPSVEPEVYVDGLGWVELGGAGIFREEVTAPWGIDRPVLAWGLGVSRVAMLRMGLKDLRQLYRSDIEWMRETPVYTGGRC
jgi:phenylalanyl-tRNA synthetase alpha chain